MSGTRTSGAGVLRCHALRPALRAEAAVRRRRGAALPVVASLLVLAVMALGCTDPGPAPDEGSSSTDADATAGAGGDGDTPAAAGPHPATRDDGDPAGTSPGLAAAPRTVVVSGAGGLPDDLPAAVARDPEVVATSVIRGATLQLVATRDAAGEVVDELPAGWWFPVEVLAFDPDDHAEVVGATAIDALGPGEAVLSASSARVRGLAPGGVLELGDGTELTVTAVVADELVGAAEIAVSVHGELAVPTPRAVLARTTDAEVATGWASLDRLAAVDPEGVLRESPLTGARGDEVPVLRNGAGVMAPARLKDHYGEFAITHGPGRWVRQGASWLREYHTITEVPIVGEVECHVEAVAPLTAAMTELVERGMAGLVHSDDFGGCWAPRTSGADALSSHAWGIAVDLNVQGNHYGAEPTIAPEVVEVMARHGFAWGGDWPVPDGMHFELVPDRELPPASHGS